jgi:hypothetical protein
VAGKWRKLHNSELRDLYSSPFTITVIMSRKMREAGHVARTGKNGNANGQFERKSEGKRQLGRPKI